MRLVINGYDIELTPTQNIARTLQVNDILTLSNRQSNYTNTFSVKRTDKNKQTFELLGVVGITNFLPYQKNECYLYTDDGECMVYKGWAVIQSTDKEYKINLYDGNIDLYKTIENKSLGDLDLSEIDHNKLVTTVVNSFIDTLPYKYIVADFNGNMVYNSGTPLTPTLNINYLVPSAKVSYLWNKIFTTYGFTYSGSIFNTVDFTNFWLSYPKLAQPLQTPTEIFNQTTLTTIGPASTPIHISFVITETATYRIDLNRLGTGIVFFTFYDAEGNNINSSTNGIPSLVINGLDVATSNTTPIDLNLNIGDVVEFGYYPEFEIWQVQNAVGYFATYAGSFQHQLIIQQFQGEIISFSNELKDFNIKDFITEILNRFGLTPFKDKYTNHYTFKTLQELLQDNDVVDWSRNKNKFTEFVSESYVFGSYAQQNDFKYKYNDTESDHYDSKILINNVNLSDKKTVVNSRVYCPEKDQSTLIHNLKTNVYKMWNKEIKDNGGVDYKGLPKRYFFLREATHTFTQSTRIGSPQTFSQPITTIPIESFYNLRMNDIVRIYYNTIGAILNYSKLVKAKVYLTEKNISDIDFSKLYWIKEMSSYFLLNKVNNFTEKGITNVELIKVDYAPPTESIEVLNNGINLLIDEVKRETPRIHFGFNQREITASVGQTITIYQDTIYNPDMYSNPIVTSTGGTVTRADLNIIEVSFATSGVKTLSAMVANLDRSIRNTSNTLNITII